MQPDPGAAQPTGDVDRYTPGHGSAAYRVERYDLDLTYRVAPNRLSGTAMLTVVALEDVTRLELDLATGLSVSKVTVDGRKAPRWTRRPHRLVVTLPAPVRAGASLTVVVTYAGNPRPMRSSWGMIGWEELAEGALVASQPSGAPSWFPCNDRPSDKATYRLRVTADSPYHVLCPGELTSQVVKGSTTTWTYEQHEPMATYLAVVHVGPYRRLDLPSVHVPMSVYLPAGAESVAAVDFARQDRMIVLFERLFGPYPFARYDVVITPDDLEIPLEAQGMSTFGRNFVTGRRTQERLVAHELAHQWFGNALTVASWQHIWLNEGFACYSEWLWAQEAGLGTTDEHAQRHWERLRQLPQDVVLADPGPADMFDDRVYKRGALTLHALRITVGDNVFGQIVRTWVAAHLHATVTTAAFREHVLATVAPGLRDEVDELLSAWLDGTTLPSLPRRR